VDAVHHDGAESETGEGIGGSRRLVGSTAAPARRSRTLKARPQTLRVRRTKQLERESCCRT